MVKKTSEQSTADKVKEKPVRKSLVESGIKNKRIGWNSSTSSITIDGKDVYKPKTNINGTAYASEGDIRDITRKAYKLGGDELVAVRDYVSSKGYSGIVNWDGENAIVGGELLKPAYVHDGKSYVPRSAADNVIAGVEKRNGILGREETERRYDEKYGQDIEAALNALKNREPFSYEPMEDPAYQAYRDAYTREAEEALRRVLNDNNTSLMGASGAVLSEAMAKRDEALEKLTDKLPELAALAYERYSDHTDNMYKTLSQLAGLGEAYYDNMYTADSDARKAVAEAGEAERKENQRSIENERERVKEYYDIEERERDIAKADVDIEKGIQDLRYYGDMLKADYNKRLLENIALQLENDGTRELRELLRQMPAEIMAKYW